MKKVNKNNIQKEKTPFVKTKVKPDNSIEVELKNPAKTLLGKIFIYIIVFGMTVLSVVALVLLLIEAASK